MKPLALLFVVLLLAGCSHDDGKRPSRKQQIEEFHRLNPDAPEPNIKGGD